MPLTIVTVVLYPHLSDPEVLIQTEMFQITKLF